MPSQPFLVPCLSTHATVGVQDPHTNPYRKPQYLLSNQLVLHHQQHQVTHQIIHYQVEEGGRGESYLSIPPSCFELQAVVNVLVDDDLLLTPKHCQELARMGSGAVSFQGCQKADPIHSVIRLLELQEYQEKRILINDIQILCKIKLQDGRTRSPPCEQSTEDVVEVDT